MAEGGLVRFIYYAFYSFVYLLCIGDGLCHTLFIFPVLSHSLLCVSMRSHPFDMFPNWPLWDIISQSCASLCVHYGPESAFVSIRCMPYPTCHP